MKFASIKRWITGIALIALMSVAFVQTSNAYAGTNRNVSAQAADPIANTITVSGFGQAYGNPNIATIQMGVEAFNADPGKALAAANDAIAKVTQALIAAGVAQGDIQTQTFNLFSTTPPVEPARTQDGTQRVYQAQIMLLVKVRDITKTGSTIDAGIQAGVTNIYGLNFGIDDTTKLESEARTKAIENARNRAAELAKILGVKLGDPIIIEEGLSNGALPVDAAYGGKGGGAAQVSEGTLSVSVNLKITFAISK
jgi:uncharacterized protein